MHSNVIASNISTFPLACHSDRSESKALATALRTARKNAGKSQEEAASHIGKVRTTLSAIETGQRKVSAQELEALAAFYGTTVSNLFHVENVVLQSEDYALENVSAFLSLSPRQKETVLHLLNMKPSKVVVRSLQLIGMPEEDLEKIACALLHHLLGSLESEVACDD